MREDLFSAKFLKLIFDEATVDEIASVAYEMLGNPIAITDAGHKLMAYVNGARDEIQKDENVDEIVQQLAQKEYLPSSLFLSKEVRTALRKVEESDSPVLVTPEGKDFDVLILGIRVKGTPAGYIILSGSNRAFEPRDYDVLKLLGNVAAVTMKRDPLFSLQSGSILNFFIADLIEGNIHSEEILQDRLSLLKWEIQKNNTVVVFRRRYAGVLPEHSRLIMDWIKDNIPGSTPVMYRDCVVAVVSRKKNTFPSEVDRRMIEQILERFDLCAGISFTLDSLLNMFRQYDQGLFSIEYGSKVSKEKRLYEFSDFMLAKLLFDCLDRQELDYYTHPALGMLHDSDEQSGEDLLRCLYYYLRNERNLVKTANEMGIHRNTVGYRLKKIQSIINVDLDDPAVALYIQISFEIKMFLNHLSS